jgi:hypothetical protein
MKRPSPLLLAFVLFLLCKASIYAQDASGLEKTSRSNFGAGIGIPYSFYGLRYNYNFSPKIAGFASAGSALVGLGYNAGGIWRVLPQKRFCPTLSAFYGTNALVLVQGTNQFNKVYTGASVSAGYEIRVPSGMFSNGFFHIELVVPFRSQAFTDDYNLLKNNPAIKLHTLLPVAVSVGYQANLYHFFKRN